MWHNILTSITKDPVNFLASLGTLLAALAAMRTIYVMKRQMHSAYRPEIFVSADNTNRIVVLPEGVEDTNRRIACFYDTGGFHEKHGLRIILHNVGAGAAKNIKINWRFDYELAVKKIEEALKDTSYKLRYTSDRKSIFIGDSQSEFLYYVSLGRGNTTSLDYVLPLKDGEFNFFPVIPTYITELYTLYFLSMNDLLVANDEAEGRKLYSDNLFENFPALEMHISYEDIAGNKFKKISKVKPLMNRRIIESEGSEAGMRGELNLNFFLSFK